MHNVQNVTVKSRNFNFQVIFISLKRMTNLSSQKYEGNGTSCSPRPPMLHPQLDDFSFAPLQKKLFIPKFF